MYFNKSLLFIFAFLLIFLSTFVNYFFVLILIFYFTFIFLLYSKPKISTKLKGMYFYLGYVYPVLALFIRYLLDTSYSTFYLLNRIEHLLFSLVLILLVYMLLQKTVRKLTFIEAGVFTVGLVVIFGNFNEILEFIVRPYLTIDYNLKVTLFYSDTIYDLLMNIIGAVLGYLIAHHIIDNK